MSFHHTNFIKDIMRKPPIIVSTNTSILEIIHKMIFDKSDTVIVTSHEKGVGLITERDIIRYIDTKKTQFSLSITAEEIIMRPLITISKEATILEADTLMKRNNIRHLAVVENEDSKKIVGQIDFTNLHDHLLTGFANTLREYNRY
ncbi:MAG: CBS domain-containing protein [Candidatus Thorarchaeota archaeon]